MSLERMQSAFLRASPIACRVAPSLQKKDTMFTERVDFQGPHGKLSAKLDMPDGAPRAYGVFAHCFTCSKDVLAANRICHGLAASKIAHALGMPASSLSFHLKELAHANLIVARQEGRFIIYAAQFDTMNTLLGFLTENCCGGTPCTPSAGLVCGT